MDATATMRVPVDIGQMTERIAVQRPYFAFDTLYRYPGSGWDIYGDFNPEQPLGHEVGPLAGAEAGRHMAILGSCAAALQQADDRRVYYLVSDATWMRGYPPLTAHPPPRMSVRARVTARSPREVEVDTELLLGTRVVGCLQISYKVLEEAFFNLRFGIHCRAEPRVPGASPYATVPHPMRLASGEHEIMTACKGLSAQQCAGHFPFYPMWPVAVVVYNLTQTMAMLLEQELAVPQRFSIEHAQLRASQLVAAEQQLTLSCKLLWLSDDRQHCGMSSSALYQGQEVAHFDAQLTLH